ncbi:dATP/dGTP diphosphohydrolase domain-containing protein [Bradyrhizobium sp. LTSP885]|uniref:dATP/dGTP diphosphohydrolase domain-containing protein n=1 Tax=Bradyrhizobium sp. LTSP885 TaxID=1619232 RepID=UPI00069ADDFF|nr:dATP/dGTP diphosphohydrolase domain-containing protein [Bradyrhizobium sp. LTSP885]
MNAPNPKKLMGDKKPPLHLLPLAGMIHQSLAHMDGDLKYGFENWNEAPVEKLTYIGAIQRHTGLYKYGENFARDTNVHNLGAVMACCAILLDAELNGNLIDNTRHSKATCDLLHNAEQVVSALKEMQREREAAKAVTATEVSTIGKAVEQSFADTALTAQWLKAEQEFKPCEGCGERYTCSNFGVCCHPPKFATCGKCDDIQECGKKGRCFGR